MQTQDDDDILAAKQDLRRRLRRLEPRTIIPRRVDGKEWEFFRVPTEEQEGCCIYEYARESSYLLELNSGQISLNWGDKLHEAYFNTRLNFALLGRQVGSAELINPWLAKEQWWRNKFCQDLNKYRDGLPYARSLDKKLYKAIKPGVSQFFSDAHQWPRGQIRDLDQRTGLEVVIFSIDWANFDDGEICACFEEWLPKARPKEIGLTNSRGKKRNSWRKCLEKLAVLRLRHYYPFEEIAKVVPGEKWIGEKFIERSEMNRACKGACEAFHELYPFLPGNPLPLHWPPYSAEKQAKIA